MARTKKKQQPMDAAEKIGLATEILKTNRGRIDVCVLGDEALFMNRLSEKTKHELVLPAPKKNAVERATTLKHNPVEEFRASPHRLKDGPTLLAMPSTAFKKAMSTAALDMPGQKKSQIGRLTFVIGEYVPIWGIPRLDMRPVRSADMKRTPDIRTRAVLARWASRFTVSYMDPLIRPNQVAQLLGAGGQYIGIGDGRPEKGTYAFGLFRVVPPDDPEFLEVLATGGREAQEAALATPVPYNDESAELLAWFDAEIANRRRRGGNTGPQETVTVDVEEDLEEVTA